MRQAILLFVFLIVTIFSVDLFLKEPAVWPDEAVLADIASNIVHENRVGTDLWQGLIPGIENHDLSYPPVFYLTDALWIKIFGLSIVNLRLLSVIFSFGFLIAFYYICKQSTLQAEKWVSTLVIIALLLDAVFLKAARVNRPEALILLLSSLAYCLFLKFQDAKAIKTQNIYLLASGLACSLAFLTHFIGGFVFAAIFSYFLIAMRWQVLRSRHFYLFNLAFLIPVLLWLISIIPYWNFLQAQFSLSAARKGFDESWVITVLKTQPIESQIILLLYLSITVIFLIWVIYKKKREYQLLACFLFFAWVFVLFGKQFWYYVLPLPFVYLSLSLLLANSKGWQRKVAIGMGASLVVSSLLYQRLILQGSLGDQLSYDKYTKSILSLIPDRRTVFLSAIPDPYFGFKEAGRANQLYEFPVVAAPQDRYLQLLDKSDYIIYTNAYDASLFGDLLPEYIKKNMVKVEEIGEIGQYRALVIELKPQEQRIK